MDTNNATFAGHREGFVWFNEQIIQISTKDESSGKPVQVSTTIRLTACYVAIVNVQGRLVGGASCRTILQNSYKGTKAKPLGKPVPTELTMSWAEWIGTDQPPVVVQARKLTPDEVFAQAMADPDFARKYQAFMESQKN